VGGDLAKGTLLPHILIRENFLFCQRRVDHSSIAQTTYRATAASAVEDRCYCYWRNLGRAPFFPPQKRTILIVFTISSRTGSVQICFTRKSDTTIQNRKAPLNGTTE
jgi:hypothetical protein